MKTLLLLLALATIPFSEIDIVKDRVETIEVNHVYDARGNHVFDQTIFWETRIFRGKTVKTIKAWRLIKEQSQIPIKDHKTGEYKTFWKDGGVMREVVSDTFRESWTQYDPELFERENVPRHLRTELTNPKETNNPNPMDQLEN